MGYGLNFTGKMDGLHPLHRMVNEGVSADGVRGVFPSVTYPSHTSNLTGAMPARHGIYYNWPFEPQAATLQMVFGLFAVATNSPLQIHISQIITARDEGCNQLYC